MQWKFIPLYTVVHPDAMDGLTHLVSPDQHWAQAEVEKRQDAEIHPADYALAQHLLAMADDPFLAGHPEWAILVDHAQQIVSAHHSLSFPVKGNS